MSTDQARQAIEALRQTGDPDVVVEWWKAEADAKQHLAEIRATTWLNAAKTAERQRRERPTWQAPPPPAPTPIAQPIDDRPFIVNVDMPAPQPTTPRRHSFAWLPVALRCLPAIGILAAFAVLLGFGWHFNGNPVTDRTTRIVDGWKCTDVEDHEPLSVGDDGQLFYWISPVDGVTCPGQEGQGRP